MEPHRNLTRTGLSRSSSHPPRAERRRAERNKPSKHEIESELRWKRGSAYFAFDDHGGWEHDHVTRQVIRAALALDGDKIFFAIEHIGPADDVPIGQHLKGNLWGCSFMRDAEASQQLQKDTEGAETWAHEGLAAGFINTVHGNGYHVLIGSSPESLKRPELKVPTFDPRDGPDPSLERRTVQFAKWYTDDYGPPKYKRADLTIFPQTKITRGFDFMFNGCNIERTAFIGALDHGPFPIHEGVIDEEISEMAADAGVLLMHDGWRLGTKGVDEHGCEVLNMWRLLPPAKSETTEEQMSTGNGSAASEPNNQVDNITLKKVQPKPKPSPKAQQYEKTKPLIIQVAEKLWGPVTPVKYAYIFNDGKQVVDPRSSTWFDHTTNRGGTQRDLIKMLQAKDPERSNPVGSSVLVNAADVIMKSKQWLWKGHLLRGAQELMSGLGGLGKSQVQIYFIACVTAGLPWPDGTKPIEPMNVIVLTAEDTLDQEVVPRLLAAGADLKRVFFLKAIKKDEMERQFLLGEDLIVLEQMAARIGNVGLICIDPITAFMGGHMNADSNTQVRSQLGPLKDFSERSNIAISTITHPAKAAGHRAIDHFIHSVAFLNAGRIAHLVIEEVDVDPDTKERSPTGRNLFTNCKNNASAGLMPTLAYRIEEQMIKQISKWEEITAPHIIWSENTLSITANEALANMSGKVQDAQPKVQGFLYDMLKSGPVKVVEIQREAERLGYTEKQLRTAKEKLKIEVEKKGIGIGSWMWKMPEQEEDGLR